MDEFFNKTKLLKGDYTFYLSFLTIAILPINVRYLPPFMILWGVVWLIETLVRNNKFFDNKKSHLLLFFLFLIFYGWQLFGMLYSDNSSIGWQNLSRRFSMILFPLILLIPGERIRQKSTFLIRLFAGSTFIFILFCFAYAFYRSLDFQNGILTFNPHHSIYVWFNYFYGSYFAIFQHPSYLSMYVLLSVFIAFESLYDIALKKSHRIGWLLISIILLISLYFLSSRAAMLAALLIVPFYFLYKSVKRNKIRYTWIIIILAVFILTPVMLKNERFNTFTKAISQKTVTETVKKDVRIIVWKTALSIVSNNFILGVGTGDVNSELLKENKRVGNTELVETRLNVHNQYIEVLLENGAIGLIIFVSVFLTMLYIAYSEKNLLYFLYIIVIMIFFLFETMLNRLAGVSFFALFSFLLLHVRNPNTLNGERNNSNQ
jgi:O-antigen ligase